MEFQSQSVESVKTVKEELARVSNTEIWGKTDRHAIVDLSDQDPFENGEARLRFIFQKCKFLHYPLHNFPFHDSIVQTAGYMICEENNSFKDYPEGFPVALLPSQNFGFWVRYFSNICVFRFLPEAENYPYKISYNGENYFSAGTFTHDDCDYLSFVSQNGDVILKTSVDYLKLSHDEILDFENTMGSAKIVLDSEVTVGRSLSSKTAFDFDMKNSARFLPKTRFNLMKNGYDPERIDYLL